MRFSDFVIAIDEQLVVLNQRLSQEIGIRGFKVVRQIVDDDVVFAEVVIFPIVRELCKYRLAAVKEIL